MSAPLVSNESTVRNNEQWVSDLSSEGAVQAAALEDLRRFLYRGLRKGIGGRAGADDAFLEDTIQDSLLLIIQKLDQFAGRSQFVTWGVSIAVRTAISALRRKHWKDVTIGNLVDQDGKASFAEPASEDEPITEIAELQTSLLDAMRDAIESALSERQRTALLAEMHGMPMERIAEQLDSNRNAIYKLTHDARKKLKQALETQGFHEDDLRSAFAS